VGAGGPLQRLAHAAASGGGGAGLCGAPVAAALLFSYPLHPPGKAGGGLRDEPLVELELPVLLVRGARDAMCERGALERTLRRFRTPPPEVFEVEGADHGLSAPKGSGGPEGARAAAAEAAVAFVRRALGP